VIEQALDVASWVCIVTGSVFAVIGGVGLLRLPDFFSRMHGAGITDTMGAGMVLVGLMLQSGLTLTTVKLLMVLLFLLLVSPTATHAVARAAVAQGIRPRLAAGEDEPSST